MSFRKIRKLTLVCFRASCAYQLDHRIFPDVVILYELAIVKLFAIKQEALSESCDTFLGLDLSLEVFYLVIHKDVIGCGLAVQVLHDNLH